MGRPAIRAQFVLMTVLALAGVFPFSLASAGVVDQGEILPKALSFDSFYQKVLSYYPRLKAAHANVDMAIARKLQASAGFWPSASVSAGMMETDDPVNVFGLLMRQERFSQADFDLNRLNTPRHQRDFQGGVHARWPLFDAMQTIRRVRIADKHVSIAEEEKSLARMEAFLMAHDAFVNAVALDKMLALADETGRFAQEDLEQARALKDKGVVPGADFFAAKVCSGRFLQARNELSRQVKATKMLLNIVMGDPPLNEWALAASLPDGSFMDFDVDSLVRQAEAARPDLLAARARVTVRQEELQRARDSSLPTVVATVDGTNNHHDFFGHGGNNAAAGITAKLPLFDPARNGRVQESAAMLVRAEREMDALEDSVVMEIVREAARFDALRINYPVLKAMADDAAKAVDMLIPLYHEGRKSILDLEDARDARLNAVSAFEELKAALFTSEARLYFLSGNIDDSRMKELSGKIGG